MRSQYCSFYPLVDHFQQPRPLDWEHLFGRHAPLDVEIGFGTGEMLMRLAQADPQRNIVGIEQIWERICRSLRRITVPSREDNNMMAATNVRIVKADAWVVFERLFTPESIDRVYCLFPCPWPKKGHVKHRLFSTDFLRLVNSRLKCNGTIQLVTDSLAYHTWVLEQAADTGFQVTREVTAAKYGTKFERKWAAAGQEEFYEIGFLKERHWDVPLMEDCAVQTYRISRFVRENFRVDNAFADGISVVFKDQLFDPVKEEMLIYAIVAEGHLTQHVRILIVRDKDAWHIGRAEGQVFFPTPGVARALELVFVAAEKTATGRDR